MIPRMAGRSSSQQRRMTLMALNLGYPAWSLLQMPRVERAASPTPPHASGEGAISRAPCGAAWNRLSGLAGPHRSPSSPYGRTSADCCIGLRGPPEQSHSERPARVDGGGAWMSLPGDAVVEEHNRIVGDERLLWNLGAGAQRDSGSPARILVWGCESCLPWSFGCCRLLGAGRRSPITASRWMGQPLQLPTAAILSHSRWAQTP